MISLLLLSAASPVDPAAAWFATLHALCGRTLAGRLEASEPVGADRDFADNALSATVGGCTGSEVRISFAVGEDRSRTWIVTRTATGVRLKHDHRHADGTEDALSRYGGDSAPGGDAVRQTFPADAETRAIFTAGGLTASLPNVWAMEVGQGGFVYELRRPGRLVRVRFE